METATGEIVGGIVMVVFILATLTDFFDNLFKRK